MQGKTINGFTLQHPLGIGGMAEVWYAENKIGKKAAVKILLPKLCQDENVVSRFLTEAKVMVDLNHQNIRQVYDYGEIDGRPVIVMEYLDGDDLKARMKQGQRFTDDELIRWWNQLVDALNYTHKKGIVHRDIKPGNIFVDNEGNIKLLDFGIAKVRESISSTQTGQKLGTLMYMSPEQVKDSKHIDYHTDAYSLAVTFVHLISGKKPYDSDTSSDFEISEQIVYKPLDLSEIPAVWRSFLTPYLNKEPEKRPELKPYSATKKRTTSKTAKQDNENTIVDEVKSIKTKHKPATDDEGTIIEGQEKEKQVTPTQPINITSEVEKPIEKKRHWFVTIWFTIMLVANIASAVSNFVTSLDYSWDSAYYYVVFSALNILNIVAVILLLSWKKNGFWLFCINVGVVLIISLCYGPYFTAFSSIIGVIILRLILQIKKNGVSCWKQLK